MQQPKSKPVHMASKINANGDVSALCFYTPKPINLAKATWTNREEAVTCKRCKEQVRIRQAQEKS